MTKAREKALDLLGRESPASLRLANVISFFAPAPLPLEVFSYLSSPLPGADVAPGRADVQQALKTLERDSLASLDDDSVTLPRTVGSTLRDRLDEEQKATWCATALGLLRKAFPADSYDVRYWPICELLLPHVRKATEHAESLEQVGAVTLWLLDRAAHFECARGRYAEANELIQHALSLAPEHLEGDDPLFGTLHHTMGNVYRSRGALEQARREHERALTIHRDALEPEDPRILEDLTGLAYTQLEIGEYDNVERDLVEALEARDGLPPSRHDYEAWGALGWARTKQLELEDARSAYERAIAIAEKLVGVDHPDTAGLRGGLGLAFEQLGDLQGARRELESATATAEMSLGIDHPEVAVMKSNFAGTLQALGDFGEARRQLEMALEAGEATLPDDHQGRWIRHRKLASVLLALGEFDASREHAEAALAVTKQARDSKDPRAAGDLSALAEAYVSLGRADDAQRAYREALSIVQAEFGDGHREAAAYHSALGRTLFAANALAEARAHFARALEIYEEEKGPDDPSASVARIYLTRIVASLAEQMAVALSALGRDDEADVMRRQHSEAIASLLAGELDKGDLSSLVSLAEAARQSSPDIAHQALDRAEALLDGDDRAPSPSRRRLGAAWYRVGKEHLGRGENEKAIQALTTSDRLLVGMPQSQGIALHDIGDLLRAQGNQREAVAYYQRAAQRKREAQESAPSPTDLAVTLAVLGRALADLGELQDAMAAHEERLQVVSSMPEREPQAEGVALHDLGDVYRVQKDLEGAVDRYELAAERKREAQGGSGNPRDLAITLLEVGRASLALKRFDAALAAHSERLEILQALPEPEREPQAEGVTLHDIGDVRKGQGDLKGAAELYEQAAERKREAQGSGGNPRDLAITLLALGRSMEAIGNLDAALPAYRERLELLEALPKRESTAEGVALHDVADVLRAKGEQTEAAELYERAAERKRQGIKGDGNPRDLAITLLEVGRASLALKRFDAALAAHSERLEILQALPEPEREPQAEGVTLHDIGDVRKGQGDLKGAAELYEQAAERKREAQGSGGNPRDLAITLLALGRSMEAIGRSDAALRAYRERLAVLATLEKRAGHSEGVTLHEIGGVLRSQGKPEDALESFSQALERKRADPDPNSRSIAETLLAITSIQLELDKASPQVETTAKEAADLLAGEDDPARAAALMMSAESSLAQGHPEKAQPVLEEAAQLLELNEGSVPLDLAAARGLLTVTHERLGDQKAAARAYEEAVARLAEVVDIEALSRDPESLIGMWALWTEIGSTKLADAVVASIRSLVTAHPGPPGARLLAEILHYVGREREIDAKDYEAAFAAYQERLKLLPSLDPPQPMSEGITLNDIGDVRRAQGLLGEAVEFYRRAADRMREAGDAAVPRDVASVLTRLGSVELEIDDVQSSNRHSAEAIELLRGEDGPNPELLADALELSAESELKLGNPVTAAALLEEAKRLSLDGEVGDKDKVARVQELLTTAHQAIKDES